MRQAVLYWDFIATITDEQHVAEMPDYMRPAHDAGLYHPVFFGRGKLDDVFTNAFVSDFYHLLSEVPIEDLLPDGKARDFVERPERYEIDGGYGHNWMSG